MPWGAPLDEEPDELLVDELELEALDVDDEELLELDDDPPAPPVPLDDDEELIEVSG